MATSPSDLVRNTYMTARHPNFSGTTGSIVSAPFVLHKDLTKATTTSDGDVSSQPWALYNGLLTENAGGITPIVPVAVPAEYAILETWMVCKTGTYAIGEDPAEVNIYGSTPIGEHNKGNLPGDLATIANMPANVNRWWTPLSSVDRTSPGTDTTAANVHYTGLGVHGSQAGDVDGVKGSGQFPMQAFRCQPLTKPVPATNGALQADQIPVAQLGTADVSLDCYPSAQWYLNGSDIVMVTVHTAGSAADNLMLMGRFHG